MPTPLLLVTEAPVTADRFDSAVATWSRHLDRPAGARLYRSLESSALLELRPLDSLADLETLRPAWSKLWTDLAPELSADVHRQVVEFVEAPKNTDEALPTTPYVQLRRVEVRPPVLDEYRAWRDRTIFETVRAADESEVFLAYHSLLSTEPGVLFVAGFSVAPAVHNAVFKTPAYEAILTEVREKYIIAEGGEGGLHTTTYSLVEA